MMEYRFEGVPRRPLVVALKNILTLGIHTKVWLYRINREMDGHEGFHIDFRTLGILVCLPFITPIIAKFQTARRMDQMVAHQLDLPRIRPSTLGWISIVPVLGAGFYAYWVQTILNRHWFHHRREEHLQAAEQRLAETEAKILAMTGGELPPLPEPEPGTRASADAGGAGGAPTHADGDDQADDEDAAAAGSGHADPDRSEHREDDATLTDRTDRDAHAWDDARRDDRPSEGSPAPVAPEALPETAEEHA